MITVVPVHASESFRGHIGKSSKISPDGGDARKSSKTSPDGFDLDSADSNGKSRHLHGKRVLEGLLQESHRQLVCLLEGNREAVLQCVTKCFTEKVVEWCTEDEAQDRVQWESFCDAGSRQAAAESENSAKDAWGEHSPIDPFPGVSSSQKSAETDFVLTDADDRQEPANQANVPARMSPTNCHPPKPLPSNNMILPVGKLSTIMPVDTEEIMQLPSRPVSPGDKLPMRPVSPSDKKSVTWDGGPVQRPIEHGEMPVAPGGSAPDAKYSDRKSSWTTMLRKSWKSQISQKTSEDLGEDDEEDDPGVGMAQMIFGAMYGKQNGIFVDAEAMKNKVREAIDKPKYNVMDFYHTEGFCQRVARSFAFEQLTLAVILLNAIWIAIDADHNEADVLIDADPGFIIVENVFCTYFFFEFCVRLGAFRCKRDSLGDAWFVFDSALLALMVMETWLLTLVFALMEGSRSGGLKNASILRLARLLRLTRVARMARLFRAMPELMILIRGIMIAGRSVGLTLVLLLMIIYLFAIAFKQLTHGSEVGRTYFPNVPKAMQTLLLKGTLPDQGPWVDAIEQDSLFFGLCALAYVILTCILLMNMLLGILVEVVKCVSVVEKETLLINHVRDRLESVMDKSIMILTEICRRASSRCSCKNLRRRVLFEMWV
jgi:hypothetical protein